MHLDIKASEVPVGFKTDLTGKAIEHQYLNQMYPKII